MIRQLTPSREGVNKIKKDSVGKGRHSKQGKILVGRKEFVPEAIRVRLLKNLSIFAKTATASLRQSYIPTKKKRHGGRSITVKPRVG
jgi:hypothetical protein